MTAPRKRKDQPPAPPVSGTSRRIVLAGAVIALVCAEAWSAPTLFALAEMAKSPRTLAWLLPAVLDTYAATSIWFGNNVPKDHPAHGPAISNTRRALLITVAANGVFHLLTLAGKGMPPWVPITLLITVMALPIYIADRLVHLYVLASGTATAEPAAERQRDGAVKAAAASGTGTAPARPAPAAASGGGGTEAAAATGSGTGDPASGIGAAANGTGSGTRPAAAPRQRPGTPPAVASVPAGGSGRRSPEDWARHALPLWREYTDGHNGTTPTAPVLADLLRTAYPDLLVPGSERSERNIRSATEELANTAPAGASR